MVSILSVSGTPEFLLLCTGRVFLLPSIWPTLAYTGPAPSASLLPVGWRELLELALSACLAPAAAPRCQLQTKTLTHQLSEVGTQSFSWYSHWLCPRLSILFTIVIIIII